MPIITTTPEEIKERFITVKECIEISGLSRSRVYKILQPCMRFKVEDISTGKKYTMMLREIALTRLFYKGWRGNPLFQNSKFQRTMALRKWYGKKSP